MEQARVTRATKIHEDTLKLQSFFETLPPGAVISYQEIAKRAGVEPLDRGRMRTALKRAKLEFTTVRGHGLKLADSETCLPILATKVVGIDRAIRRADTSQRNIQEQFFNSLSEEKQRAILYAGAVFGAIRLCAEQAKQLQGPKKGDNEEGGSITLSIPIPKLG